MGVASNAEYAAHTLSPQRHALADAEAVLLVNSRRVPGMERDMLLEQRVGADTISPLPDSMSARIFSRALPLTLPVRRQISDAQRFGKLERVSKCWLATISVGHHQRR